MGSSDWDCLAFNSDGKPTEDKFVTNKGYETYLSKGRLVVDLGDHGNLVIHEGVASLAFLEIVAQKQRNDRGTFFVFIEDFMEGDKYSYYAGISAKGYMTEIEWLAINHPIEYENLPAELKTPDAEYMMFSQFGGGIEPIWGFDYWDLVEGPTKLEMDIPRPDLDQLWTGITPAILSEFTLWLNGISPAYAATINVNEALRFNQFDGFENATPLGKSTLPTFYEFLKVKEEIVLSDIVEPKPLDEYWLD